MTQQKNNVKTLFGFLDFFIDDFKNNKVGIDIRKDVNNTTYPFYDVAQNSIVDKIYVKDPLNGRIISLNSYEY